MNNFTLKELSEKRKSVRTYLDIPLNDSDRKKITDYIELLSKETTPFNAKVRISIFDVDKQISSKDLGTYGVIKNAKTYLGVAATKADDSMEAVGYVFEKLVLFAASIGLGTCWLGGTFNKSEFAKAMNIQENEFFPIASPIGYPAPKNHTVDKIMRKAIKADSRKDFESLFFENNFSSPLSKEADGKYTYLLETVRLSPSAKNGQPWRVLKQGCTFHFFEKRDIPSGKYDIQRLDVGIAGCHFDLAAKEQGLNMKMVSLDNPPEEKGLIYVFSFVEKSAQ